MGAGLALGDLHGLGEQMAAWLLCPHRFGLGECFLGLFLFLSRQQPSGGRVILYDLI